MSMENKDNLNQLVAVNELAASAPSKELIESEDFSKKYDALIALEKYIASVKEYVNNGIKEVVKENYYDTGESSISSEGNRYTYIPETVRESLDTKTLKIEEPETYKKYVKISPVKETFRVTKIKKKEDPSKIIDMDIANKE